MRAIDADALIADCQLAQKQADRHGREFANAFYSGGGEVSTEWWCVEDMIENAPTIEPQRKKGKWIEHNPHKWGLGIVFECSECGEKIDCEPSNFCPNCGADMRIPVEIARNIVHEAIDNSVWSDTVDTAEMHKVVDDWCAENGGDVNADVES